MLVECGVEVQEIREEPAGGNLACELVQVVVPVFREVADAAFFLPYLNREYGGGTVPYAFVCRIQDFPDDTSSLG